jgi:hypothetical protein
VGVRVGGWAAVPAVAAPGAAEQPATDDDGAGKASQNTSRRRSVDQRSLSYWLPQAWVRSTGQRRLAWIGAGTPRVAIWPAMSRSASTCRQVW